jgi:hypothetical protein
VGNKYNEAWTNNNGNISENWNTRAQYLPI